MAMLAFPRTAELYSRNRRWNAAVVAACLFLCRPAWAADSVRQAEQQRIELLERLSRTVVCIFQADREGGGSGVIIAPDGLGLTNYHVVEGMMRTRRGLGGLSDGKLYELGVLGVDVTGDVALFRLLGKDRFAFAELGDSDSVRVGDRAIALGNPFALADDYSPTVTLGIVSGVHRFQPGRANQLVYSDCIQIDTSINPGNSGGPLFDAAGRLIGINGRISAESRGRINVGLGFAIPINQIRRFLPGLRAGLYCAHGTMEATVYDAPDGRVVIDRIQESGPAWEAGLRLGDALLSLDAVPLESANRFLGLVGTYPAGWPLPVVYERAGRRQETIIELAALPVGLPPEIRQAAPAAAEADPGTLFLPADSRSEQAAHPLAELVSTILARVVRLYGASIGREPGYGAGVLVSADGKVVTVLSLLIESPSVQAITADGRRWRATVKARDERRHLALLQLEAPGNPDGSDPSEVEAPRASFPFFAPGDSTALPRGAQVLAAANPFNIAEGNEAVSVTLGTFSGRSRLSARRGTQPFPYHGEVLVLDSVTSNPGSPGGAVIDLEGRWIGLIGKRVHSTFTNTSLNYAVPVEEVVSFLSEAEGGEVAERTEPGGEPYHGIRFFELGYNRKLLYVESVRPNSPAERAGLRPDDLIMSVDGQPVSGLKQFRELMTKFKPGDQTTLVIKRGDRLERTTLVLEARQ